VDIGHALVILPLDDASVTRRAVYLPLYPAQLQALVGHVRKRDRVELRRLPCAKGHQRRRWSSRPRKLGRDWLIKESDLKRFAKSGSM
jgi:hypothetical protein